MESLLIGFHLHVMFNVSSCYMFLYIVRERLLLTAKQHTHWNRKVCWYVSTIFTKQVVLILKTNQLLDKNTQYKIKWNKFFLNTAREEASHLFHTKWKMKAKLSWRNYEFWTYWWTLRWWLFAPVIK